MSRGDGAPPVITPPDLPPGDGDPVHEVNTAWNYLADFFNRRIGEYDVMISGATDSLIQALG